METPVLVNSLTNGITPAALEYSGIPINTAMGTAGTGGFGIRNDSFTSFSPYIQWVVTIFMILFGVNFNAYYLIVLRQFKKAVKVEEVRCYFGIILAATAIIFVNIYSHLAKSRYERTLLL